MSMVYGRPGTCTHATCTLSEVCDNDVTTFTTGIGINPHPGLHCSNSINSKDGKMIAWIDQVIVLHFWGRQIMIAILNKVSTDAQSFRELHVFF